MGHRVEFWCLFLAFIAITQAIDSTEEPRPKRDLNLLNNLLTTVFQPIATLKASVISEKLRHLNSVPLTPLVGPPPIVPIKPEPLKPLPCPPLPIVRTPMRFMPAPLTPLPLLPQRMGPVLPAPLRPLHFLPQRIRPILPAPLRPLHFLPQKMGPILPAPVRPLRLGPLPCPPLPIVRTPMHFMPAPLGPLPLLPQRMGPIPPAPLKPIRMGPVLPQVMTPIQPPIAPTPIAPIPPTFIVPAPQPRPIIVPAPEPLIIPSFKYIYDQKNQDGSITTVFSKNGKDVLVATTDAVMKIPPPILVDRVEKIVNGVPFTPMVPRSDEYGPIPRPVGPLAVPNYPAQIIPLSDVMVPPPRAIDTPPVPVIGNPLSIAPPSVDGIENFATTNKGYSFKLTNDEGYLKQGDEKIFYSRLMPSPYYSPAPLITFNPDDKRKPNQHTVVTEDRSVFDGMEEVSMKRHQENLQPHYGGPRLQSWINNGYSYKQVEGRPGLVEITNPDGFVTRMQVAGNRNDIVMAPQPGVILENTKRVKGHEHIRPDGTTYLCYEEHTPVFHPVLPLETNMLPRQRNGPTTPKSRNHVIHRGSFKYSTVKLEQAQPSIKETQLLSDSVNSSPKTTPFSLGENPIVVLPPEQTFSYKVNKADGSSIDVSSSKDNTISVKINNRKSIERRGDIPEAL